MGLLGAQTLSSPAQESMTQPDVVHSKMELLDYVQKHGPALDASSKAFADRAVRDISQHWTVETLAKYAHPKLIAAKPKEHWEKMFTMFSKKLGPLKTYLGSDGEAKILVSSQGHLGFTAHYESAIGCEKDKAKVKLALVRVGSTWYITEFFVFSDAFIN
jgi:hypothetical protein